MDYWFVNVGEVSATLALKYGGNRSWDDCRTLGFISAGQDPKYSNQLRRLYEGAEIFAYLKRSGQSGGYVGHGRITTSQPAMARDFTVNGRRLLDYDLRGTFLRMNINDPERAEYVVGVEWYTAKSRHEGLFYKKIFAPLLIVCQLKDQQTLQYLLENFDPRGSSTGHTQPLPPRPDRAPGVAATKAVGRPQSPVELEVTYVRPELLAPIISSVEKLKLDPNHLERAHESLVESFFEALGYEKYVDIKHQQGRIDLSIQLHGKHLAVVEVKRDWGLTWRNRDVLRQAYDYAREFGAKYVIITNGDYYAFFDQETGLSYEQNFKAEFRLTALTEADLPFIESLKKPF